MLKRKSPEELGEELGTELGKIQNVKIKKVLALIDAGAKTDLPVLALASMFGHAACMEVLIDTGRSHENEFRGALAAATQFNQPDCVKVLIDKGIGRDTTACESALAQSRSPAITKLLNAAIAKGKEQFLEETDFSAGTRNPIPAKAPLQLK
jgi:hypothetical protein